ncbi:hypothetical protein JCM11251_002937 [Rhodosporidiobolus azoricus]
MPGLPERFRSLEYARKQLLATSAFLFVLGLFVFPLSKGFHSNLFAFRLWWALCMVKWGVAAFTLFPSYPILVKRFEGEWLVFFITALFRPFPYTRPLRPFLELALLVAFAQSAVGLVVYFIAPWTKQLIWSFKAWRAKENAEDAVEDQVDGAKDAMAEAMGKVKRG